MTVLVNVRTKEEITYEDDARAEKHLKMFPKVFRKKTTLNVSEDTKKLLKSSKKEDE